MMPKVQPKAVHYIVTIYTIYIFQRSLVSLSKIKIPTVFSEITIFTCKVVSFNAVSFSAVAYWNVSHALNGVLLYSVYDLSYHCRFFRLVLWQCLLSGRIFHINLPGQPGCDEVPYKCKM